MYASYLIRLMRELKEAYEKVGLQINFKKTEVLPITEDNATLKTCKLKKTWKYKEYINSDTLA